MLATQLSELLAVDLERVDEALDIVSDIDSALVGGVGRPDPTRDAAFAALASATAGTPLGAAVSSASEAIAEGTVTDEHLAAIAAARTGVLGAVHDALSSELDAALGRPRSEAPLALAEAPAETAALRGAARAWLCELAIAGFAGVTTEFVAGATSLIEGLHAHSEGRRLAVLLDGLCAELRSCDPIGALPTVPARRWADMWARAEILSRDTYPASAAVEQLTGRFLPVGVETFEHPAVFGFVVHGVFESSDGTEPRLMRTTVAVPKVDAVNGPSSWMLFGEPSGLRDALAQDLSVDVTDMPAVGGDFLWDDAAAKPGIAVDPISTARLFLATATAPGAPALDRHPVAIAEPVYVERYTVVKGDVLRFDLGGAVLDIDVDRISSVSPITEKHLASSTACIGVLRWDAGRWSLAPMVVETPVKRVPTVIHTGQWAAGPTDPKVEKAVSRANAVGTLRERAGKLLRK